VGPIVGSFISGITNPTPTRPTYSTYTPPTTKPSPTTPTSTVYTPGPPDLNPAPAPWPAYSQIDTILTSSTIYSQELTPIDCEITNVDLVSGSIKDIEKHMNEFVDCLMTSWYPAVVQAGFDLPHPSVTVYTQEITSQCGAMPMMNAVYCTADQQIYYAKDLIEAFPSSIQAMRFLAESVIAHEFGHAIQYRTMILMSEAMLEEDATTEAEQMQWSRRTEMQADCFAGVFLNSVRDSAQLSDSDEANIAQLFNLLGGTIPNEDDHGMGVNRAAWVTAGMATPSVGVCNTFVAPDNQVS
jgi:predicted metalloprotease